MHVADVGASILDLQRAGWTTVASARGTDTAHGGDRNGLVEAIPIRVTADDGGCPDKSCPSLAGGDELGIVGSDGAQLPAVGQALGDGVGPVVPRIGGG